MTKFNLEEKKIIDFALEYKPELSEYQKQEIKLERKGTPSSSLRFKKDVDVKKIAENNKINQLLKKAFDSKLCPVLLISEWKIEGFDARKREIDYAEFIKRGGKRKSIPEKEDESVQIIEYSNKNKLDFFKKYLHKRFFSRDKIFMVDNYNRRVIDEMFKYFIKDPSCKFDLSKGLFVCGQVGTGKTELMKAFSEFTNDNSFPNAFKMVYMEELNIEIDKNGLKAIEKHKQMDICFDDIAMRQTKINSYGTDVMPSDSIMQMRYKRFSNKKTRPTHYTSNIDFNPNNESDYNNLLEVYDIRSVDRIREMCNFVYLGGPSRRR